MSEQVWFTADHHFGHKGIIKYSNRPFANVDEMNESLIDRWNAVVKKGDRVYYLGDLSFLPRPITDVIVNRLNGQIYFIKGNHDKMSNDFYTTNFVTVDDLKEIYVGAQKIVLCHYAMLVWNGSHHGAWMLHGHSHGSLHVDRTAKRMDVGVDAVPGYRPIEFAEVRKILDQRKFKPVDHHTERS